MSLPVAFVDAHQYFSAAIEFLNTHSWIYKHANTRFIKVGILEAMPLEVQQYFIACDNETLNQFPFVYNSNMKINCDYLKNFHTKLKELIPEFAFSELPPTTKLTMTTQKQNWKMNPKKQHEIERLSHVINELCVAESEILVDFGAGLGYLSELLFMKNNKFLILGLEADEQRVKSAQKRLQQILAQSQFAIHYKQHFIDEDSNEFIIEHANQLAQAYKRLTANNLAIIGLHACADLTITAIKLFLENAHITKLIIMPCCYHKLKIIDNTKQDIKVEQRQVQEVDAQMFKNFPLSASLQRVIAKTNDATKIGNTCSCCFNRPFLRLACQQTTARWICESELAHRKHGQEMFLRGVGETLIDETAEMLVKSKQKTEFLIGNFEEFSKFYELRSKETNEILTWNEQHENKFNDILQKYDFNIGAKLAEGLTCLQTALQKLCENIVLYDRLCFMEEYAATHGLKIKVQYQKLLNEKLSPRCYVLIAKKL